MKDKRVYLASCDLKKELHLSLKSFLSPTDLIAIVAQGMALSTKGFSHREISLAIYWVLSVIIYLTNL